MVLRYLVPLISTRSMYRLRGPMGDIFTSLAMDAQDSPAAHRFSTSFRSGVLAGSSFVRATVQSKSETKLSTCLTRA